MSKSRKKFNGADLSRNKNRWGQTDLPTSGPQRTNPYAPSWPMNNEKNHDRLLQHVKDRLDHSNTIRNSIVDRFGVIDRELSGFIRLEREDLSREQDNRRGKAPKPVKTNLQLVANQIDEAVTYMLEIFFPETGMFQTATKDQTQQPVAQGLADLMNRHADTMQYFRNLMKGLDDGLKYNMGGWLVYWDKKTGVKPSNGDAGKVVPKAQTVWEGNVLEHLDMYNFLWDLSVHPVDISMKGEYFAIVNVVTEFKCYKMEQDEEIFDVDFWINTMPTAGKSGASVGFPYYRPKPSVRSQIEGSGQSISQNAIVDWADILTAGQVQDVGRGIEVVDWYGWLNPYKFGMSKDKKAPYSIWHVIIINGCVIAKTEQLENMHGLLPVGICSPREDNIGMQQKSYAEMLLPMQRLASFLFNTHIDAVRKALYGITIYNPRVFPDLDRSLEELVAGKIPMKETALDIDLNKVFKQINDVPDTSGVVKGIADVMDLMQKQLPTDMLKQVADLDRATEYQAAATVQGSNRRAHKLAMLVNDQALNTIRFQMLYNILQYQQSVSFINRDGKSTDIDPTKLRDTDIEFAIGDGLKGVDRLIIANALKEILNSIIQSQEAIKEIDIVAFLDYFMRLIGNDTSLTQFRRPLPGQPVGGAPGPSPAPGSTGTDPVTGAALPPGATPPDPNAPPPPPGSGPAGPGLALPPQVGTQPPGGAQLPAILGGGQ